MSVSGPQLRDIAEQFLAAYPDINDFTNLVLFGIDLDLNPDDISPPTRTRQQRIMQIVAVARAKGWIKDLMLAALDDAARPPTHSCAPCFSRSWTCWNQNRVSRRMII